MNWNDCTFEASLLMVELEENVPFYDSAISLNLGLTNVDGSPMLQDPHVKGFIKSFEKFGSRAGVEIDNPVPLLKDLPGIFITPGNVFSREEVLDALDPYLPESYIPYIPDFYTIGFFPSRVGKPVREIAQDGKVYEKGVLIGTEGVIDPPQWALDLAEWSRQYCNGSYNHYKVSENGSTRKAYVTCNSLAPVSSI